MKNHSFKCKLKSLLSSTYIVVPSNNNGYISKYFNTFWEI